MIHIPHSESVYNDFVELVIEEIESWKDDIFIKKRGLELFPGNTVPSYSFLLIVKADGKCGMVIMYEKIEIDCIKQKTIAKKEVSLYDYKNKNDFIQGVRNFLLSNKKLIENQKPRWAK